MKEWMDMGDGRYRTEPEPQAMVVMLVMLTGGGWQGSWRLAD